MFDRFHSRPQRAGAPSRLRPDRKPLLENLEDRLAPAIIGGTVYADLNGNGLLSTGEPGLAHSTLQLQDKAGNVLATTTSNQLGQYQFTQRTLGTTTSAVQTVDAVFSPTPTNSSNTVSVNQFNPALGTLNEVDFIATGSLSSNVQLENLSPGPAPFQVNLGGSLSFSAPGLGSTFSSTTGSTWATGGTGAATTGTATTGSSWTTGGSYLATTGTATSASDCTTTGTSTAPSGPNGPTYVISPSPNGPSGATNGLTSVSPGSAISNPLSSMSCGAGWMSGGASTTTSSSGSSTTGSSTTTTGTTTSSSSGVGCTTTGPLTTTTGTTTLSAMSSGQLGTQWTGTLAGFPAGGQLNLSGPSSANLGTKTLNGTFNQVSLTSPQALAAYTGTGKVNVTETGSASSCVSGPGNLLSLINTVAQGDLKVVYKYTPSNDLGPGQYNIVQTTQPPGFTAGLATSDNITPIAGSNLTHTIPVTVNTNSDVLTNNNFGEIPTPTPTTTPTVTPNTTPNTTPSTTPSLTPKTDPSKYFLISGLGDWW